MFKDYYQMREWVESFIPYTYSKKNLGLERIRHLLKLLGNPQKKFKSILVAGTSGKGSTAYYIARLLQYSKSEIRNPRFVREARRAKSETNLKYKNSNSQKVLNFENSGFDIVSNFDIRVSNLKSLKIGLHVSPHLVDIRERMQIFVGSQTFDPVSKILHETGSSLMPMRQFLELFGKLRRVVEKIQKENPDLVPSYFEILVAASFLYFAQEKVDWAVVEVGLGGRLDATNVLKQEISVITNVGLDHTEILGETIEKIAFEKAGIIKKSTRSMRSTRFASEARRAKGTKSKGSVITGARGKALKVIEKVAKEKNARLININTLSSKNLQKTDAERYIAKQYYAFRDTSSSFASSNRFPRPKGRRNLIFAQNSLHSGNECRSFFAQNKNLALLTVLTLMSVQGVRRSMAFNRENVKKAFSEVFPGRFEIIDDQVIIDGAHNVDKTKFLIRELLHTKYLIPNTKYILVVAFKKGKDWKKMLSLLVKNLPVNKIIATRFNAPTDTGFFAAVEPAEIEEYIKSKWKVIVESFEISQQAVFEGYQSVDASLLTPGVGSSQKLENTPGVSSMLLVTGSLYLVGEARTLWKLPNC